jgi:ribosomal protein S18 acetylase RimI-like enzyme
VTTAALTLQSGHQPDTRIGDDLVAEWARSLSLSAYQRIRTNAIGPAVADDLSRIGFGVRQELVLLRRDIEHRSPTGAVSSHKVGRVRFTDAVSIDLAAFGDEWAIDHGALSYAVNATQEAHLRGVGRSGVGRNGVGRPSRVFGLFGRAVGYCLTGFTEDTGYVQRLAVHPSSRQRGIARALVADALDWLAEKGATSVYVNTDVDNTAALHLYATLGFEPVDYRLQVMEISRRDVLRQVESVNSNRDGAT